MATSRSRPAGWFALVALVGAVGLVACGDDSDDPAARQAGPELSTEAVAGDGLSDAWVAGNRAAQRALGADPGRDVCGPGTSGAAPRP